MDHRKELKERYKNRTVVGGVYRIWCRESGRAWIKAARDLASQVSRFQFAVSSNLCPEPGMRSDWETYGAASFSFEILEEIKQEKTQSDEEFASDVDALLELWRETRRQEGKK